MVMNLKLTYEVVIFGQGVIGFGWGKWVTHRRKSVEHRWSVSSTPEKRTSPLFKANSWGKLWLGEFD